ncbi:MAG: SAM-dependent methyltransferase [Paludibacteraceae bacterium]|jgi:16S rRNA (cytidine1402-2'-O)-methyltransferase|nr:SAM-dependent methyltransferase [Paludibacteraceae bacterium]MBQ3681263.1 SAM-dependent methyltransferase [Paludibacteraceae bacterium]MBQ6962867.1 SAM-dependent methyltransferase [Paludibacteraceae bacterium]MBR2178297.1 SAM-dependent methyltransferase [Paludibacteraceae bacterium]MBR6078136.1 SAM-dependent methyltransferase [Paludibacteraceae bacterium]
MPGILFLIPNTLGENAPDEVIPQKVIETAKRLRHFIVEDVRTVRRYLRRIDRTFPIDDSQFFELNQHTDRSKIEPYLKPLLEGNDMGIISEAGCPAVADPGADIVALAHRKGIRVVPLVGPSSILLAQMASGFNGQSFAFVGYLPIEAAERQKRLRKLEHRAKEENQTQLFIETPYRNMKLFDELTATLKGDTRLCIACDITLESEYIETRTIGEWKQKKPQDLNKRPTIFGIF